MINVVYVLRLLLLCTFALYSALFGSAVKQEISSPTEDSAVATKWIALGRELFTRDDYSVLHRLEQAVEQPEDSDATKNDLARIGTKGAEKAVFKDAFVRSFFTCPQTSSSVNRKRVPTSSDSGAENNKCSRSAEL